MRVSIDFKRRPRQTHYQSRHSLTTWRGVKFLQETYTRSVAYLGGGALCHASLGDE